MGNSIGFDLVKALLLWLLLVPSVSHASIETYQFSQPEMAQRFNDLTTVLRCPKCQNQNLADSDSIIAKDLRAQVHQLLEKNHTNDQITDFMVQRYGDFILYDPPFKRSTLVLWLAPIGLLLMGLLVLWFLARKPAVQAAMLTPDEQQQLNDLLASEQQRETHHD
ncbi:MAG: cytochrome c-type biogenesis protein CcmH [Oceanospirillaceae bacterium]|nr:cytochrome c-type biogenesis protein CcmH [Oceanospirillaceae bacterium]